MLLIQSTIIATVVGSFRWYDTSEITLAGVTLSDSTLPWNLESDYGIVPNSTLIALLLVLACSSLLVLACSIEHLNC